MPVTVRIEIEPRTLAAMQALTPENANNAIVLSMAEWAPILRRTLGENSPGSGGGNTGAYRRSWNVVQSGPGVEVTNSVKYARFVEEDTRPHRIEPVRARVLAWRKGKGRVSSFKAGKVYNVTKGMRRRVAAGKAKVGDWFFAMAVDHPGTKGQHVLENSIHQAANDLLDILAEKVQAAFRAGG